jgi:hypothetical protein
VENQAKVKKNITIVSGLPRSGTSMMMQMLRAGGMGIVTDEIRKADEDNPRGYLEWERVKKLKEDRSWLNECSGKAVKVISMLLFDLPSKHHYKIIFMQREIEEVLASQRIMLERRGETKEGISDEEMAKKFSKHLTQVGDWIAQQRNMEVLYVPYNEVIKNPLFYSEKVNRFLGENFNTKTMAASVEAKLYRQRKN